VIERAVDTREPFGDVARRLLDGGARREEHPDPAPLPNDLLEKPVAEKLDRLFPHHLHSRGSRRIEREALHDIGRVEVPGVERRVHRCRQPDEAAPDALAERETQLQLGGSLMDFIDDQRVVRQDVTVLEPATRDAGRDDDDVPRRRLRCRLALSVDDANA